VRRLLALDVGGARLGDEVAQVLLRAAHQPQRERLSLLARVEGRLLLLFAAHEKQLAGVREGTPPRGEEEDAVRAAAALLVLRRGVSIAAQRCGHGEMGVCRQLRVAHEPRQHPAVAVVARVNLCRHDAPAHDDLSQISAERSYRSERYPGGSDGEAAGGDLVGEHGRDSCAHTSRHSSVAAGHTGEHSVVEYCGVGADFVTATLGWLLLRFSASARLRAR
jgi:hypothetical protein